MKLIRKYLLYAVVAAVVVYSGGVLYRVQHSVDLGIECLFTNETNGDEGQFGPEICLVDLEASEVVGPPPQVQDVLRRVGGQPTSTFLDFRYRIAGLRSQPVDPASAALEHPEELLLDAEFDADLVAIGDQRWVRVELLRSVAGTDQPARWLPMTTWLRVDPLPPHVIGLSLTWFALAMMLLAIGGLVFWKRPGDWSSLMFFALCVVNAITFFGAFHWSSLVGSRLLVYPFVFCAMLLAPLTLHFYLLFPRPLRIIRRWPQLTLTSLYAVPGLFLILTFACLLQINVLYRDGARAVELIEALSLLSNLTYAYLGVSAVFFVLGQGVLIYGFFYSRTAAQRNQVKWLLAATVLACVPIGYLLYAALFDRAEFAFGQQTRMMIYLTSLLFAVAYAVSITRYKLMQVGRIVNRGLLYVAISLAATGLFCLMVGIGTALVGKYYFRWENAIAAGLTAMLIVVVLGWVRDGFQRALDRRFVREKYQLDGALKRLSKAVDRLIEPAQLARQMLQSAMDAVGAERGMVYLRDKAGHHFTLAAQFGTPAGETSIDADSALAHELRHRNVLASRHTLAVLPSAAQQQLRDVDGELAFALEQEGELLGLVILGAKEDRQPYTAEDRNFLVALARTTTLALHSAEGRRTLEALKEKMQQKLEKIAEQQQRISFLQGELSSREKSAAAAPPSSVPSPRVATPAEPDGTPLSHGIRGSSAAIKSLLAQVSKVAQSSASVLIRGESGTGKEILARAIHQNSPRAKGPFVGVHCAALSSSLLESELFGHVKGAFTGADRDRKGRFEMADGGTLFLDEVGDISLETQTKLLRVLQERSFERVGGVQTLHTDVRLIAATHRDLEELIARGEFREDLFYRLNVISLVCPPLRERQEDLYELALHFVPLYAERASKPISGIDDDALRRLAAYAWPGNVRQLENVIERAVVLAEGNSISLHDLPPEILQAEPQSSYPRRPAATPPPANLDVATALAEPDTLVGELADLERERLIDALAQCRGNKSQAARVLGIPRSTLFSKLRKLGLA